VKKIKLLALDIDGVLTDGRTTLGVRHPERKRLAFQDLDAINAAKRAGLIVALVTGESDGSVDLVAARTGVTLVRRGAKDKLAALKSVARKLKISLNEICYVGDGNRDAPALAKVGLAFAPANATFAAKSAALCILPQFGGHGAVSETVRLLLCRDDERSRFNLLEKKLHKHRVKSWSGAKTNLAKKVDCLTRVILALARAKQSGRKIMLCGDMAEGAFAEFFSSNETWPVIVLSSTYPVLIRQVRALAQPQDVIIAFNSRKRSPHLVKVLKEAETRCAEVIPFFSISTSGGLDFVRDWSSVCHFVRYALTATD